MLPRVAVDITTHPAKVPGLQHGARRVFYFPCAPRRSLAVLLRGDRKPPLAL